MDAHAKSMESDLLQNDRKCEFHGVSVSHVSSSSSREASPVAAVSAWFVADRFGGHFLRFGLPSLPSSTVHIDIGTSKLFKLGPKDLLCVIEVSEIEGSTDKPCSRALRIEFETEDTCKAFHLKFELWKQKIPLTGTGALENRSNVLKCKFDDKIEATSAMMYFHYYGQLLHQQNMLQDYVRTGTYFAAMIENCADFNGRIVVDVGAGSSILSLFAAKAGAKHVYAIEASEMADYACQLVAGNPSIGNRITVIKGKVEEVELPEKADILISETMGTLLVNERMLESYIIARDRFLVPNGKMFPSIGRIHVAPFSDESLHTEIAIKAIFWQQKNFFGVDLSPLHGSAFQAYFSQPVVDAFDPRLLVSPATFHTIDFTRIKEEELYEIDIPLHFTASVGARVHGLACWFDVLFDGSSVQRWLTTAPGAPTTHWYQLRCLLSQPIYVLSGQEITGRFNLVAHSAQSYTINLTMSAKMFGPGADQGGILQTSSCKINLKDPYYRMAQSPNYVWNQDQELEEGIDPQEIIQTPEEIDPCIILQTADSPEALLNL
ncbi:probable histone-arginine methyltransferase CARM1 [Dendrobium catenatum]|uniref:probable histone-arginine methyltransferase CARM1 n=1 Tax=Dendrobium catenatum TaxID=906689 RepID=UPI0009F6BA68|nr:probable histone-arginine methyltransferase CARM1 [Dendrobium catenatum]